MVAAAARGTLAALLALAVLCCGVQAAKHSFKKGEAVTLWANKGACRHAAVGGAHAAAAAAVAGHASQLWQTVGRSALQCYHTLTTCCPPLTCRSRPLQQPQRDVSVL